MSQLKILNKKEIQKILQSLEEQYGFKEKLDYAFLLSEKNKIYIVNRDIERIDLSRLRVNSYGLYLGELKDNGQVRLSIEGSQIVGKHSDKNILGLDDDDAKDWLKGYDIGYDGKLKDFVMIKNKEDFLGCGKIAGNKLLNHVPKIRRMNINN
ncbi:MAG: hypothetical protein ABIJ08_01335 [Nanoarchaeota archaeon]